MSEWQPPAVRALELEEQVGAVCTPPGGCGRPALFEASWSAVHPRWRVMTRYRSTRCMYHGATFCHRNELELPGRPATRSEEMGEVLAIVQALAEALEAQGTLLEEVASSGGATAAALDEIRARLPREATRGQNGPGDPDLLRRFAKLERTVGTLKRTSSELAALRRRVDRLHKAVRRGPIGEDEGEQRQRLFGHMGGRA